MSKMEVDEIDEVTSTPEQKHDINMEILELIKYRQKRKWYSTVGIVVIFLFMLSAMFGFIMGGIGFYLKFVKGRKIRYEN